jgi:hypothetical protein
MSAASGGGKENARSRVRVDQCVSAVRSVEVPVLVCLRSSCNHVTKVGGAVRFVRLALKVVIQNDGDFVDVIQLYVISSDLMH